MQGLLNNILFMNYRIFFILHVKIQDECGILQAAFLNINDKYFLRIQSSYSCYFNVYIYRSAPDRCVGDL